MRRPEVMAWMSDEFDRPQVVASVEEAREKLLGWAQHFDRPPRGYWAVVPRGATDPVGAVCLITVPNDEHGEVEIGWWLHPDAEGRGYVTEAAQAVLAHGFAAGLEEIWAAMYPDNGPSAAVARRLGMTELGVREVPWYPGPSLIWRLSRPG